MTLQRGDQVSHAEHGVGRVEIAFETTAIVRFNTALHEVALQDLNVRQTVLQALEAGRSHAPVRVLLRVQAELITALNDSWGVFSRSRIALLPHQLWVCRQVLNTWPPRWLIADDVGLGKTVEAGLILWPLLSRRQVTRLLIICPASLTEQWQQRLKAMFDIRVTLYHPDLDRPHAREGETYWDIHNQVVASMQTLRENRDERHERLIGAEAWDLVIVDEAHHLNVDEVTGATLAFRLLERMQAEGKIGGLLLFTATPHRGKDHGFMALLQLLRPELFDVNLPLAPQLRELPKVMIRNNKQTVTDLSGKRLFQTPVVSSEEYHYSPEEAAFYTTLTEFISSGKAYAATLGNTSNGQAVMLVLIALQKLASSSVTAVRRALTRRHAHVDEVLKKSAEATRYASLQREGEEEAVSALEEGVGEWASGVLLMENERARLEELLKAAGQVREETKILAILEAVEKRFEGRSVLFFTEYKATQSLLLTALAKRYGAESVTFINGDERADDVAGLTLNEPREEASRRFNAGEVRFLVATEAAGEGIDLQQHCHTLIHVDLPWNPMRLHQRVGRLNRYGQTHQVEVLSFRNASTVEALIWDKLNAKIARIMAAFGNVMDEPEDLLQLVLGMTSPHVFQDMFARAADVSPERLDKWFDHQTANIGGQNILKAVEDLVGHSASFDYQQVSASIPRVDLEDLLPFFRQAVDQNQRAVTEQENRLSFKTPEKWQEEIGVRRSYEGLAFTRDPRNDPQQIAGVGHRVVDAALAQAREYVDSVAVTEWPGLEAPLYVYRVAERITTQPGIQRTLVGRLTGNEPRWLKDWELLQLLNVMKTKKRAEGESALSGLDQLAERLKLEEKSLADHLEEIGQNYTAPLIEPYAVFAPRSRLS